MMESRAIRVAVCITMLLCGCEDGQLSLRVICFNAIKSAETQGGEQNMYPDMIIRISSQNSEEESFVLSNEAGIGYLPMRPGKYCYEAYDSKGCALYLDEKQHAEHPSCFSVEKNQFDFDDLMYVVSKDVRSDKCISLGYAHFLALGAESANLSSEKRNPGVIVRVAPQVGKGESFVLSDRQGVGNGIGLIPFRPGDYCFEGYGYKNAPGGRVNAFRFEVEKPSCFSVRENETTEVEVTVPGSLHWNRP